LRYLTQNNLKYIRTKQENIVVSALFSGRKIEMDYFFEAFVDEILEINKTGGIQTKLGMLPVY
jgi:hypothetical protein